MAPPGIFLLSPGFGSQQKGFECCSVTGGESGRRKSLSNKIALTVSLFAREFSESYDEADEIIQRPRQPSLVGMGAFFANREKNRLFYLTFKSCCEQTFRRTTELND
jgi:hypothetical protein